MIGLSFIFAVAVMAMTATVTSANAQDVSSKTPVNFEPEFSGYCPQGFGGSHVKVGTVQRRRETLRVNADARTPTNLYNEPVAYVAGLQLSL